MVENRLLDLKVFLFDSSQLPGTFLKENSEKSSNLSIHDILANMTDDTLFSNAKPHQFIINCGLKVYKIIKELFEVRKLIGYFAIWDQVLICINKHQL
ncbi:hypothetical protein RCL_jg3570.t1 [Rhizophagus clarus]|uniref:Uncharacterized protein n=1 Tax=Rhizophagus clarus TaxID=94130 RepID=A0A8H3M4W8_9GLOM|nr:hypothetical protein RCL_jg3570.t1 [Rhizophagus clarus]